MLVLLKTSKKLSVANTTVQDQFISYNKSRQEEGSAQFLTLTNS